MNDTLITRRPLWRQPLLHFVLVALAIFALDAVRGDKRPDNSQHIVVTVAQVERLAGLWQKTWGRAPTETELQALVRDHIREEVYYREALNLGLDIDDTVIRRRLRQKIEFLISDQSIESTIDDAALNTYYQKNIERYRQAPLFDFTQVYFSAANKNNARQALISLREGARPDGIGEPLNLPQTMEAADDADIIRVFGSEFYAELSNLPPDVWTGPIKSGFGFHIVRISRKKTAHISPLAQNYAQVRNDWLAEQNAASKEAAYEELRARYDIDIEVPKN